MLLNFPIEIIRTILDEVVGGEQRKFLGSLVAVALSCRDLAEIALDILWETQTSLTPLVQCLPSDLWNHGHDLQGEIVFSRPLQETDFARFDYYRHRILQFGSFYGVPDVPLRKIHRNALRALAAHWDHGVLLPNVHRLLFDKYSCDFIHTIDSDIESSSIVGPSLLDFTLNLDEMDEDDDGDPITEDQLCSLFSLLPVISPNIQSLVLEHVSYYGPLQKTTSLSLAMRLPQLRYLELPWTEPSREDVLHLSSLPFLEELSRIEIHERNLDLFTTRGGKFPNLKSFYFRAYRQDNIGILLDAMQCDFEFLSILDLDSTVADYQTSLISFTKILRLVGHYRRLRIFFLYMLYPRIVPISEDKQPVLIATRPLFSLSLLQEVSLNGPFCGSLDDSWILRAAESWPRLKYLSIPVVSDHDDQPYRDPGSPKITLEGLIPLIQRCNMLASIQVCISLEAIGLARLEGIRNQSITSITASSSSTVGIPSRVFSSLVAMLPNLPMIFWSRPHIVTHDNIAMAERWDELDSLFEQKRLSGQETAENNIIA